MADDAKGGKSEPLPTMQMPLGGDAASGGTSQPLPTMQMPLGAGAEPIMKTLVPNTAAPMPDVGPPEMPPELRYEYGVEIARGGMGRVVDAHDTLLGRTVALKEALSLDPESVRRFERETRITARLEHPSIVPVHDAGIAANGSPFYVMRKITGRPLEELVGRAPDLGDRLALLPHVVAAANAVAHAHERGIVHRDIKPSNILCGELGETTVIDWGLAKAIGESDESSSSTPTPKRAPSVLDDEDDDGIKTRAGIVFGTPGFMAPEQLRGAPVDERCDVYAIGATLYHLLGRRPPHYHKQGAEMMKAAVEGPPTSLLEIAPGVPPELATIVDKALAHDRAVRYPDARALADDLQRFLTGQLVASHHYSSREKALRWLRKNRTPVLVAGAAATALIVFGAFAVRGVMVARDRAERERRKAVAETRIADDKTAQVTESLQKLTLFEAHGKAADEPTRAVAMIKPLVTSPQWKAARDVAATARANGVAYALAASPHTLSLELSRDGLLALAAGDDGRVRIYDLVRRTNRMLYDAKSATPARFGDAEHTVVLFHDTHITLVDVASGSHRDVMTPTAITKLEVSGPIAYWIDPQHAVWKLDLAGGAPSKLALDEPVDVISPSPDGHWVALAGKAHLMMVDRTDSTLPAETITSGAMRELAWAADASHVIGLTEDEYVDISMQGTPNVMHRFTVGAKRAIAYASNGHTYSTGPTGISVLERDDSRPRIAGNDFTLGVREARGGTIVAGRPLAITIMSEDGDRSLASPLRLARVETSPRGPFVVGASDGRLLVWSLDDILAQHVADSPPSGARFVTGDQLVVTYIDEPAQWIDLRTNKAVPLGMMAAIAKLAPAPDGQRAVVIDATHHARLVAPVGDPIELDGDIDHAVFLDDRRLLLATATGIVRIDDRKQTTTLAKREAPIVGLATAAGSWIVAAYGDRTMWRTNLDTKTETKLEVPAVPPSDALAIDANGDVVFGSGNDVRLWKPDAATSTVLATLGRAITMIAYVDATRVLAVASDGSAAVIDTQKPDVRPLALPIATPTITADGALVASLGTNGVLEVIDPLVEERWPIATSHAPQQLSTTQIAPDGRRVLATTSSGLLVWTVALPTTAEATAQWLDHLTNALAERGPSGPLSWK